MKCTVLFFAQLAEKVGRREWTVELASGATVADALDAVAAAFSHSPAVINHVATAVNEKYATGDTVLHDGDRIALIPPVSGG